MKLIRKHRRDLHAVTIQSCVRMFLARLLLIEKQREAAYVKLNRAFSVISDFKLRVCSSSLSGTIRKGPCRKCDDGSSNRNTVCSPSFHFHDKLLRLKEQREELIAKSIRDELNSNAKNCSV